MSNINEIMAPPAVEEAIAKEKVYEKKGDGDLSFDAGASPAEKEGEDIDYVAMEKKLVRKIDLRILICIVLLYLLNYLDRNSISAARLKGLEEDLNLKGQEYETALSILYVGYILLQIPSNLLLAHIGRPRIYIPSVVCVWGIVSACTAATHNFRELVVVRFFLGISEAAFFPGALYLLSRWYTRREVAKRMAVLYGGSILSNAVSGLISAGILGNMEGKAGIRGWQWLFIIEGAITVFIAICSFFILPDFPHNSKMLTPAERKLAVQRLADDAGEVLIEGAEGQGPKEGLILAAKDPIVWLFALCLTATVTGVAFNQFFPTIVGTLGYNNITTLIITFGPWGWAFLAVMTNAWHADKTGERTWHLCIPLCVGIIGFIISSVTTNLGARFFALFIEAQSYAGYVLVLSWMSNSIRGTYKRAVGLAAVNCISQLGNIAGSYVWPSKWGPSYWRSNLISACCFLVAIGTALVIRLVLVRRNRDLDRRHGTVEQVQAGNENLEEAQQRAMSARQTYRYLI